MPEESFAAGYGKILRFAHTRRSGRLRSATERSEALGAEWNDIFNLHSPISNLSAAPLRRLTAAPPLKGEAFPVSAHPKGPTV